MPALPQDTPIPPAGEPGTFRSLGDVVASLKSQIEAAIVARDDATGSRLHEALVRIEAEEDRRATVRRCAR